MAKSQKPTRKPRPSDKRRDEERGFGPESGRGRFSGRYTREQDEKTGGRQHPRRDARPDGIGGTRDWYEPERQPGDRRHEGDDGVHPNGIGRSRGWWERD